LTASGCSKAACGGKRKWPSLKKRKGADGKAIKEEAGGAEEDANVPGPPPLPHVKRGGALPKPVRG